MEQSWNEFKYFRQISNETLCFLLSHKSCISKLVSIPIIVITNRVFLYCLLRFKIQIWFWLYILILVKSKIKLLYINRNFFNLLTLIFMLSCFADNRIAMENLVHLIKFVPFFQKVLKFSIFPFCTRPKWGRQIIKM